MTKRTLLFTILGIATVPANAQVIEVGVDGAATVYDAPTIFADEGSTPVFERAAYAGQPSSQRSLAHISVPDIEREYGLPSGIVDAVMYQESRGRMNAVSVKGALGLMQLMPGTAAQLGVNPYIADQNIRGGAMYLRQQMDRFGSIPLALAAYNAGPGAVMRYRGIPPYRETQNYVASILGRWRPPVSAGKPAVSPVPTPPKHIYPDNAFFIEVTDQ